MAANVAVGSEIGATSVPYVRVVDAETGAVRAQVLAFEAGYRGGVRVAMGDLDGDGTPEVLAASGPGRVAEIRVFRQVVVGGQTTGLSELTDYRTLPFGAGYRGGLDVASGDVDGDGREDIVAAMSRGGGTVNVFRSVAAADPVPNTPFRSFTPFNSSYDGGASVAVADVGTFVAGVRTDGTAPDNRVEILVGSGVGMAPVVKVYDVSATPKAVATIVPSLPASFRGGVSVTSGRVNADGLDDIMVSTGRGGGSTTIVFDGQSAGGGTTLRLQSFTPVAGLARPNAPLFTAAVDLDGDGRIDRFLATQGDAGGTAGITRNSAAGARVGTVTTLAGPLRIAAARAFFRDVTTASGLTYRPIVQGSGELGGVGKLNTVNYTGTLLNGTKFDSSRDPGRTPFVFRGNGRVANAFVTNTGSGYTSVPEVTFAPPPAGGRQATGTAVLGTGANAGRVIGITITDEGAGYFGAVAVTIADPPAGGTTAAAAASADRVIEGWNEIIGLMRVGSRYRVVIPANLGYGNLGQPKFDANGNVVRDTNGDIVYSIPPDSPLVFDMELLAVSA